MAKEREIFINGQVDEAGNIVVPGCVRNGIDKESANKIFDEMAEFAKYAFNKSHAAAYAVVSYRTAYLKAYYPAEFIAATLNSYLGNLDKIPLYIDESKSLGLKILKPDINKSKTKFTVDGDKIRFGLGSIKNVGIAVVDTIVEEREKNGDFKSFTDFCERIKNDSVNKKCIESLIKAGTFDEFGETRSTLLASFENIIDTIQSEERKNFKGQVSMFDLDEMNLQDREELKYTFIELKEFDDKELLSMEKEMLGIYLSGHPLEKLREQIFKISNIDTLKMKEIQEELNVEGNSSKYRDGQEVKYAGIIVNIKKKYTKSNKLMAFATIEDLYGQAEVIIFENSYQASANILVPESIVLVEGRLSIREDDGVKIVARNIKEISEEENKVKVLKLNITNIEENQKKRLRGAIKFWMGEKNNTPVQVIDGEKILDCGAIYLDKNILNEFIELMGKEKVKYE